MAVVHSITVEFEPNKMKYDARPSQSMGSRRSGMGMEAELLQPMGRVFSPHDFTAAIILGREPRLI
jgi:hypothetical protein